VGAGCFSGVGLRFGGFLFFQGGVDGGVGADFVVGAVGPGLDGEIFEVDARNAAFADDDFAEDVAVDGDGGAGETVFTFIRGHRGRQLDGERDQGNFLLQFAEGGLIHANAAQVVAEDGVFGIGRRVGGLIRGLTRSVIRGLIRGLIRSLIGDLIRGGLV